MTDTTVAPPRARGRTPGASRRRGRAAAARSLHAFLIVIALIWLFPLLWRSTTRSATTTTPPKHGYLSFGGFTFDNYTDAWEQGDFAQYFLNSLIITVPAVLLTLFLASWSAFVLARFCWRFNLMLLGFFMAATCCRSRRC